MSAARSPRGARTPVAPFRFDRGQKRWSDHCHNDRATGVPARRAKLNANQQALIEALTVAGGRADVDLLHSLDVPRSTLSTLVQRGLVDIIEEPAEFHVSRVKARPSPFGFEFNPAQKQALQRIQDGMSTRKFGGILLHGVTGSGKTAVYLAAMRTVLEAGSFGDPAGAGNRPHADRGRRSAPGVRRRGGHPALGAVRIRSAPNSGIASSAGKRAWWSARVRPYSRPSPIWR